MRRLRGRATLLAALAAAGLGGCHREPPVTRHVILITLDTLRADHLGCYGYPRETSPVLDRLAAEGVRYRNAFAPMATTVPSHTSLFTSRLPLELKVLKNGHRLADDVPTLAEILAEQGFETAAFVGTNGHFIAGGLSRGFQVFDEPTLDDTNYRPGAETVALATRWLEQRRSHRPLFLWVHLFDAHQPYQSLHRFEAGPPREQANQSRFLLENHRMDLGFYGGDEAAMLETMDLYDGEVRAVDRSIGDLQKAIRAAGLESQDPSSGTLWVIAGDHGEGLGNHGWMGHGKHIYNEQLRVPLIFHHQPPLPSAGEAPGNIVELLDVLPTVLELTGREAPGGLRWRGFSLASQLMGAPEIDGDRQAFGQRRQFDPPDRRQGVEVKNPRYEAGEKFTLQGRHFKYELWTAGPDKLFAIDRDPYEVENLLGRGLPEEQSYRREIRRIISGIVSPHEVETVDDETVRRLKSLGYDQ